MSPNQSHNLNQDFDPMGTRPLLECGIRALGLNLVPEQINQFLTYLDLVLKWNQKMNLTALRSPREIIIHHFLDSLLLLPYLPDTGRLLDLGSGAGFPGIPLKIFRPGLTVDLAEATAKKVSFLKEALRRLGLSAMNVIPVYLGKEPVSLPLEVSWDFFVSRGVKLEAVLRAVNPFWGPAQRLLLMKGPDWREEIEKQGALLKKQQIGVERIILLANPLSARQGVLVILGKTGRPG